MKHLIASIPALLLCACASAPTPPDPPPAPDVPGPGSTAVDEPVAERPVQIDTFRYSARLREGDALWFVNEHGDLRMRKSGDGGVHFAAVFQKLDGEPRDPEFGIDRRPGGLEFRVRPPADWIGRVDASARVPPASALELSTGDGLIEVRAGDNPVVARSASGAIHYRGGGTIDARTEHGDAQISISALDYETDIGSVSAGGNVELWIDPRANLLVRCMAGGNIAYNVPDGVARLTRHRDGAITMRLGKANAELVINAGGNIAVEALPTP